MKCECGGEVKYEVCCKKYCYSCFIGLYVIYNWPVDLITRCGVCEEPLDVQTVSKILDFTVYYFDSEYPTGTIFLF